MKQVNHSGEVDELLEALADKIKTNLALEHGLLCGRTGQLLFLYSFEKAYPGKVGSNWLSEKLNDVFSNADTSNSGASFGYGIAGKAWFYQYILQDQELDDAGNANVDKYFSQLLSSETWEGELEFVLGLVGYVPYLMRRRHTARGKENLSNLINKLSNLGSYNKDGVCYWKTPSSSIFRVQKNNLNLEEINMGLAHGHVGVLAALAAMCKEPSLENQAKRLLEDGCDWLLSEKQNIHEWGSYFPYVIGNTTQSRLGWCYGDLTIALTIGRAAEILNRNDYSDFALDIALHSATRGLKNSGVKDAALCHGYSGVALIFYLLYEDLGCPSLLKAAFDWQDKLLSSFKETGWQGLHKHGGEDSNARIEDYGLLEGYAGIGLSLLTLRGFASDWSDSMLLG